MPQIPNKVNKVIFFSFSGKQSLPFIILRHKKKVNKVYQKVNKVNPKVNKVYIYLKYLHTTTKNRSFLREDKEMREEKEGINITYYHSKLYGTS